MQKIKIGISACLLGSKVRYDGEFKPDRFITDNLGPVFEWMPVCPEVEFGLPVPREPMHLIADPPSIRIVTINTGIDHTEGIKKWASERLIRLEKKRLCGFIFKSKSPSCGIWDARVISSSMARSKRGMGIFAGAFICHFPLVPVIDERRLHNSNERKNFIERVVLYKRGVEFLRAGRARFCFF